MGKKIKISETQLSKLKNTLVENAIHSNLVKQITSELSKNYKPIEKFVRQGGEYFEKKMIEVLADGEVITPKSLFEYLQFKYKVSEDLIKQIIKDWASGSIDDNFTLTKNIPLS